jgi:hypothetical protein
VAEHSEFVTRKTMTIHDFEAERARLLQDKDILAAWLDYFSRFSHQRVFFRVAPQYENQVPLINGRRHGKDVNLYKLFLEQCIRLLRPGGECGSVIPSGIYTDLGSKKLRELLFTRTHITGMFGFENRKEVFEGVHRSFKFIVLTFEKGGITNSFPATFMRHDVSELGDFPQRGAMEISVELIYRLSPDSLSISEFKCEADIAIAKKMLKLALLGDPLSDRWNLELHREFNMTDDAHLFKMEKLNNCLALYEGKMIHQFNHQWDQPRYWIPGSR